MPVHTPPNALNVSGASNVNVPAIGDKLPFINKMNALYATLDAYGTNLKAWQELIAAAVYNNESQLSGAAGGIDLAALQAQMIAVDTLLASSPANLLEPYLTRFLDTWFRSGSATAPVTEILEGIQCTRIEDPDAGTNSNYELADTTAEMCRVVIKWYRDGSGNSRLNRDTPDGSSTLLLNHATGNATGGGGGTPPTIENNSSSGRWVTTTALFTAINGTSWDFRPRLTGTGVLRIARLEFYAPEPAAAPAPAGLSAEDVIALLRPYSSNFTTGNWLDSAGVSTFVVLGLTHGKGKVPFVQVLDSSGVSRTDRVDLSIDDANGKVTIETTTPNIFAGKIQIFYGDA